MKACVFLLPWAFAFLAASFASAAIVEHTFNVKNMTIQRLCKKQVITAVNGSVPGPTIRVREGDVLVVHVLNNSPYNITIHWHGVTQYLSAWADGPAYVTQCPIRPKHSYTYKFKITGQEGTLWWHAHFSALRATVYGALIIRPRSPDSYPFPTPYKDVPILLGDWFNSNVVDDDNRIGKGGSSTVANAHTINSFPGDLYKCSQFQVFKLKVRQGKTYLLRIINAALDNELFFKVANHKLIVVAVDACYTKPYVTDVVVTGPGQTMDVLLTTDQPVGFYSMIVTPYISAINLPFNNNITRGIMSYIGATLAKPLMPAPVPFNDTPTAHQFYTNITGLVGGPHWVPVPRDVDEHMFITIGVNLDSCPKHATCAGPAGNRLSASMNNESFVLPTDKGLSMLEAFYYGVSGIYSSGFPKKPRAKFDYTNPNLTFDTALMFAPKSTKVKRLKFNSTVEIVYQNTAFIGAENHPMHLHGFNFHVLAQGFGNYKEGRDRKKFNFEDPQIRNTIAVPTGGWAVIRFQANNPGVWSVHCHIEAHVAWGLAMAFEVENGPTPSSTLPPPPPDLPKC